MKHISLTQRKQTPLSIFEKKKLEQTPGVDFFRVCGDACAEYIPVRAGVTYVVVGILRERPHTTAQSGEGLLGWKIAGVRGRCG